MFISPNDWKRFRLAGWRKVLERPKELNKKYNDNRISKMKEMLKDAE